MIDTGCERRSPTMANRRGDPPNISGHTFLQLRLGLYSFVFGLACISIGLFMDCWIGFYFLFGRRPTQYLSLTYYRYYFVILCFLYYECICYEVFCIWECVIYVFVFARQRPSTWWPQGSHRRRSLFTVECRPGMARVVSPIDSLHPGPDVSVHCIFNCISFCIYCEIQVQKRLLKRVKG